MRIIKNIGFSVLTLLATVSNALAQDVEAVCKPIVKSGLMETSYDVVNSRSLETAKSFLCKQKFSTYNQAVAVDIGGSFNFMDVLKGSPDDTVDASNYSQKRSSFCSSSASDLRQSSYSNRTVKSINTHIANIYKDCVTKVSQATGEAIAYIEPSSDLTSFKVHVVKSSGVAEIEQFSAFPLPTYCTGGLLNATPSNLVEVRGSAQFQCINSDPRRVVALNGNFKGDGRMFRDSKGEVPKREDNFDALTRRLQDFESNLLDTGTKSGMVAFFTTECPAPSWKPYVYLEGRYAVGVPRGGAIAQGNGVPLTNLENRTVGKHRHNVETQQPRRGSSSGNSHMASSSTQTKQSTFAGEEEGTNAPYLQLMACVKN